MQPWTLLEILAQLRAAEPQQPRTEPLRPATARFWTVWRRRLAQGLIGLGLRLDADASRAAIGSIETSPWLNGSDA